MLEIDPWGAPKSEPLVEAGESGGCGVAHVSTWRERRSADGKRCRPSISVLFKVLRWTSAEKNDYHVCLFSWCIHIIGLEIFDLATFSFLFFFCTAVYSAVYAYRAHIYLSESLFSTEPKYPLYMPSFVVFNSLLFQFPFVFVALIFAPFQFLNCFFLFYFIFTLSCQYYNLLFPALSHLTSR